MGVDMALTTTTCGANGLDADGVGCSEWTFESKLTDYAEYPPSDGMSSPCVKCRRQALKCHAQAALRPTFAAQGCEIFRYMCMHMCMHMHMCMCMCMCMSHVCRPETHRSPTLMLLQVGRG